MRPLVLICQRSFLLCKEEEKSKSKIDPKCKKREYEKINKHTEYDKFYKGLRVQWNP